MIPEPACAWTRWVPVVCVHNAGRSHRDDIAARVQRLADELAPWQPRHNRSAASLERSGRG